MKKTFSFFEYVIIIIIVGGALSGSYYFLKRFIQAYIRRESDTFLGVNFGSEESKQTQGISWKNSRYNRLETDEGEKTAASDISDGSITYSAPIDSGRKKQKGASRDIQDVAFPPPSVEYPDLEYKKWEDQKWPLH